MRRRTEPVDIDTATLHGLEALQSAEEEMRLPADPVLREQIDELTRAVMTPNGGGSLANIIRDQIAENSGNEAEPPSGMNGVSFDRMTVDELSPRDQAEGSDSPGSFWGRSIADPSDDPRFTPLRVNRSFSAPTLQPGYAQVDNDDTYGTVPARNYHHLDRATLTYAQASMEAEVLLQTITNRHQKYFVIKTGDMNFFTCCLIKADEAGYSLVSCQFDGGIHCALMVKVPTQTT